MPTFNERPPALMTVRPSILVEITGLILMAVGLSLIAYYFVTLFEEGFHAWWILAGGVLLAGIGFQSVFDEERLVLDRRTKTVFLRRPLRRHVNWSFDEVATVKLLKRARSDGAPATPKSLKECWLLFKDGTRLRVFRGRVEDMDDMARKLAEYTESPLEEGVL